MDKNKKLLTFDDLYDFYSQQNKSVTFDSSESEYNIVIQSFATFDITKDDLSEGLLYGKIKAFHDLTNSNRSYIKTDVLKKNMLSIQDRPIMADIVDVKDENGNTIKDFNGHSMQLDKENDKIIYIEKPVGHFVNPENITLEYDEKYDRNFVVSDCVIYEEYTDACEILRRRQEVDCSVELVLRKFSWDSKKKVLIIEDFYVQGCTLLGAHVKPGMPGSKLTLKDFSEDNNSLFLNFTKENNKISNGKENTKQMSNENFIKTFEISHEDIRYAIYKLLEVREKADDTTYWIAKVFDDYFIYEGEMSVFYGQQYIVDNDVVSFVDEPYRLYAEFLTENEKAALDNMRENYKTIEAELNIYKEAEDKADKMTIFEDEAYANYLNTNEFKALMSDESIKNFSKEELIEKADAALGKLVKLTKTFCSDTSKKNTVETNRAFMFSKQETKTSFLDGLLNRNK